MRGASAEAKSVSETEHWPRSSSCAKTLCHAMGRKAAGETCSHGWRTAEKPPARQRQRRHMRLHFNPHVGVTKQAIPGEVVVRVQKGSETESTQGSLNALDGAGSGYACTSANGRPRTWQGRCHRAPRKSHQTQQQGHAFFCTRARSFR